MAAWMIAHHSTSGITLRSHQQYAGLARTRIHLYDDGNIYIDLATLAKSPKSASIRVTPTNNP